MREAHVVGRGFPSCGPVAMLSLTARRKLSGGSGFWVLEAADVSHLVIGVYRLGSHQVGGMLTSGNELLQASRLRALPRTRGMGEPGAQARQPAIQGHEGRPIWFWQLKEMRKSQASHLCVLSPCVSARGCFEPRGLAFWMRVGR